jgi:hypothetical protein
MTNDQCSIFQVPNHPPAAAASFSDPHPVRQRHVAGKLQREGQHFDAFVRHPALVFFGEQFHVHGAVGFGAELVEQADELVFEQVFEEVQPLDHAGEAGIGGVVVFVEGDPVADVVAERAFGPHAEVVLFHVEPGDAHRGGAPVEVERPVGLGEEVVEFFDAFIEAHEHGPAVILFVLDERQPVMEPAGVVVVVVEQFVFPAGFAGYGAAEGAQFPGFDGRVEGNRQNSELLHRAKGFRCDLDVVSYAARSTRNTGQCACAGLK